MKLLRLKDIGKIYVSDENVSVGIRGVNLSFDSGEIVAITGESGSGKSTLLNVISGMDSYEEGELYINDEPTSHFVQEDWEEYRKANISFIFQNYNIIDSFTVLENVELALMHIENPKERRNKALELIERVGLKSHIKHKGSKLSGGQKQRTVIARALAKDSPIILADEPTGNLDSKTSKEIIELLKEVAKDKLLIIVTHDYEEVKDIATRHIRVFNGAIESDTFVNKKEDFVPSQNKCEKIIGKNRTIKNGISLGGVLFKSKPRLTSFLSFLLFIGLCAIFFITSIFDTTDAFEKETMFNPIEGRLVIANRSGKPISDEDLEKIVEKYDARYYLHYDLLLDNSDSYSIAFNTGKVRMQYFGTYTFDKFYGDDILGKYPSSDDEVLLYLPIDKQEVFGKDKILIEKIDVFGCSFKVVGVKYFYDNNKDLEVLFTKDGFRLVSASKYISQGNKGVYLETVNNNEDLNKQIYSYSSSFDVEENKIYINKENVLNGLDINETTKIKFNAFYVIYDNYGGTQTTYEFKKDFDYQVLTTDKENEAFENVGVIFNSYIMIDMVEDVLAKSYKQASIFFENDNKASKAIELLEEEGYIAVLSSTEYKTDGDEALISLLIGSFILVGLILSIVFMSFFINLCTNKSIASFKNDIAIMRSMGISKNVIKVGMYTRMLLCLIPGVIFTTLIVIFIYLNPSTNPLFRFLYYYHYLAIFFGMLLLTLLTTRRQIKKLFNESVKKSLKGGA